jgi:hypothetical protein
MGKSGFFISAQKPAASVATPCVFCSRMSWFRPCQRARFSTNEHPGSHFDRIARIGAGNSLANGFRNVEREVCQQGRGRE